MSRPTHIYIDVSALLYNFQRVQYYAPGKKIIAMVKANAYGCGVAAIVPILEHRVAAFGVACLEEALTIRKLGSRAECILFQGIFSPEDLIYLQQYHLQCVVHHSHQIQWILAHRTKEKIKIWLKIDSGMHRLGFKPDKVEEVMRALLQCPWVECMGFMTHLACADTPNAPLNASQLQTFQDSTLSYPNMARSMANSAAIISLPQTHADIIRPGIMLYGVSPFGYISSQELGLRPVMQFVSQITAIHHYPANTPIGYGATWKSPNPSRIGVVPVGYGDGYPRHVSPQTPVWIRGHLVPIVGRISMDMLNIDLTKTPFIQEGDTVELWGKNLMVEEIARKANTLAYELLCQASQR